MMADKLPSLAIVWLLPDFFVNLVMCQHLVYVLKKVQENLILGFRERDLPPLAEYPALVFPDFQSRGTPLLSLIHIWNSYGFRPNRNCRQAVAMCYKLAQVSGLHYVVDIDIKGFFDNVDHGKLLKQIWTLGIRDKCLLSLISKMLKAPIEENGVRSRPEKGTPQGLSLIHI